jgi:hypothetical protein
VDRDSLLWTLVVFFGASVLFSTIGRELKDEGVALTIAVEVVAGLLVIGLIVLIVRRRGD